MSAKQKKRDFIIQWLLLRLHMQLYVQGICNNKNMLL